MSPQDSCYPTTAGIDYSNIVEAQEKDLNQLYKDDRGAMLMSMAYVAAGSHVEVSDFFWPLRP